MIILFNCIVSHDNDLVKDLILNINRFVVNPIICLHINPIFKDFNKSLLNGIPNVYVNDQQIKFEKYDTKIKSFISNYNYIHYILKLKFDYHMIFYDQMMFCRSGIEGYLEGYDSFFYKNFQNDNPIKVINPFIHFPKGILSNVTCGICSNYDLTSRMFEYFSSNSDIYNFNGWCGEEVFLASYLYNNSNKSKMSPMIAQPKENATVNDAKDIVEQRVNKIDALAIGKRNTDEIFILHRIRPIIDNDVRLYIRSLY